MRKLILSISLLIAFSANSFANCIDTADAEIKAKEEKLIRIKKTQSGIRLKTGVTVGILNGAFWGTMFGLIADGATVSASILVGTGYGIAGAGAAVAVVSVPMIVYNQVLKAQIRSVKKTKRLLLAAQESNTEDRILKKMYRKVRRKLPGLTMEELMDEINLASDSRDICPEEGKVYTFSKIKRFLKRQDINPTQEVVFEVESASL